MESQIPKRKIHLVHKGILSGKNAYVGPDTVEFDLTNRCDNSCLACWVHSPLLEEDKKRPSGISINTEIVKNTLQEVANLRTRTVVFSGSGEPFLHPDIFEIIKFSKKLGLKCKIVTGFTTLDREKVEKLVELGVDDLTVSIWAGKPQTYVKLHPNKSKVTFWKIKDTLKYLTAIKRSTNPPKIKIYNVICSYNFYELEEMLDFALDVGVENLEFQVVDIIPQVTEFLSTDNSSKSILEEQFLKLRKRIDCPHQTQFNPEGYDSEELEREFEEFGRFLEKIPRKKTRYEEKKSSSWGRQSLSKERFDISDFFFFTWPEYKDGEKHICRTLTCPNRITTVPTVDNPQIIEGDNILIFKFPWQKCLKCAYKDKCLDDFKPKKIEIKYLSLLGFGSFYRRIMSSYKEAGRYDENIIKAIPCYAGWIYSRILCSGEVIPCCKGHLVHMGNVYTRKFSEIWNSDRYRDFRIKSRSIQSYPEYFKKINCEKGCDNLGMNLKMHAKLTKEYGEDFLK